LPAGKQSWCRASQTPFAGTRQSSRYPSPHSDPFILWSAWQWGSFRLSSNSTTNWVEVYCLEQMSTCKSFVQACGFHRPSKALVRDYVAVDTPNQLFAAESPSDYDHLIHRARFTSFTRLPQAQVLYDSRIHICSLCKYASSLASPPGFAGKRAILTDRLLVGQRKHS